jgi:NAD(P)-dependent dehydrogenase (short-subunit alcohol dehydrogenase family)
VSRTIVVTGAASGLGAAVRAGLEAAGDRVLGVDLAGTEIVADLSGADGRAGAVRAALEQAAGAIDGLVVCAGLGPHVEDTALIASVNYFGAVSVLDGLRDALRGDAPAAVAIASNSSTIDPTADDALADACVAGDEDEARRLAAALPGHSVYATSKRALARAVRHRAPAWGGQGVRLNAVAPGPFESPLLRADLDDPVLGPAIESLPIPLGRRAAADEIAAVVLFLLSTDAAYVHGSVLFADGGTDALLYPDRVP